MAADELLKEIKRIVRDETPFAEAVSDIDFEGPKLVLYCKNLDLLMENGEAIKDLARKIRKRIILRPDPSILTDKEDAEKQIRKMVPEEAGIKDIIFSEDIGEVTIEADKPGVAIGKGGALLREIMYKISWTPRIVRAPPIKSDLLQNIQLSMIQAGAERRDLLRKIGRRIHREQKGKGDWVRFTALGGAREVGRSCFLLQTPESKIMVDCGVNVASEDRAYPHLEAPEVRLPELDAVVLSHAHLDHCVHPETYIQLSNGEITQAETLCETLDNSVMAADINGSLKIEPMLIAEKVRIKAPPSMHKVKVKTKDILVTPEHPFFILEGSHVVSRKARELKKGDFVATVGHIPFSGKPQQLPEMIKNVQISPSGRKLLIKTRKIQRLRQVDLANKIGCTQATISEVERNGTCSLSLLKKILTSLGIKENFAQYIILRENRSIKIFLPKVTTPEFCQFLGYVLGDGCKADTRYHGKRFVQLVITDKNEENLKIYSSIAKQIFNTGGTLRYGDRKRLHFYSPLMLDLLNSIDQNILSKSPNRKIPELVHKVSKLELAGFLRGLYDAEGSIGDHGIVLTSTSTKIIRVTQLLLLRFGITSHIYESPNSKSKNPVFHLAIYSLGSIRSFKTYIGFSCRKVQLDDLARSVGGACAERMDLIPVSSATLLEIADKLSLRKIDLRRMGIPYHHYSTHHPTRRKLREMVKKFEIVAKEKNVELDELTNLKKIIESNISWEPIQQIDIAPSNTKFVYDLKVPGHSNYIANGFIVHNCGFIPYLFKYGFEGPVYCTPATRDLAVLLQMDYVEIAEREGKPLPYTKRDIGTFLSHCIPLDYGDVTDIAPDVRVTLNNAGHILGSSILHFHIGEGLHNIVYTGDIKFDRTRLLSPAMYDFPRVETLIIESTYGGAEDIQPHRTDAENEFIHLVTETIDRGGKVVVPAFAVGRAQETMVLLEDCKRKGLFKDLHVYLDGMIWEATAIHTAYPEYLSQDLRDLIFRADENPFLSDMFTRVSGPDQRASVIEGEPSVIISTAGMMAGGPIMEYFKRLAPDPNNTLIFVGYQSEGSLGRRIQKGWREIPLSSGKGRVEEVKVNMDIRTVEGFSGHSDRAQLLNYVRRISSKPQRVLVVHGDAANCMDLASALHRLFRVDTRAMSNLETIRLR